MEKSLEKSNVDFSEAYTEYKDEEIRTELIKMFKSQKRHLQTIEALKDQIRKLRLDCDKAAHERDQSESKLKSQRAAYEKRILSIYDESNKD